MFCKCNGHDNFNVLGERNLLFKCAAFPNMDYLALKNLYVTLRIRLLTMMEFKCCCFIL